MTDACEKCDLNERIIHGHRSEILHLKEEISDLHHRMKKAGVDVWLPTPEMIDGPDDKWVWAIVNSFRGCQEYGDILMWWDTENVPSMEARVRLCEVINDNPELVDSLRMR